MNTWELYVHYTTLFKLSCLGTCIGGDAGSRTLRDTLLKCVFILYTQIDCIQYAI